KRDLVDKMLVRVFHSLKKSGLINDIIRMSLTDDEVRESVASITIELLRADVISWEEVFVALKDSGLAIDVVRFSLTDEETRNGLGELVKEILPDLLESGAIDPKDLVSGPSDKHGNKNHGKFKDRDDDFDNHKKGHKRDDNLPIEGAVPISHPIAD
ncbi:uncharacterized protein SPAPADRAFT_138221, partial [Spathaspora passalidarum NRRL Y-27907]